MPLTNINLDWMSKALFPLARMGYYITGPLFCILGCNIILHGSCILGCNHKASQTIGNLERTPVDFDWPDNDTMFTFLDVRMSTCTIPNNLKAVCGPNNMKAG